MLCELFLKETWKTTRGSPFSWFSLQIFLIVPQELSVELVNICGDQSLFFFRVKDQNNFFFKFYVGYVLIIENSKLVMNFSQFYLIHLEKKKYCPKAETILKVEKEVARHNF